MVDLYGGSCTIGDSNLGCVYPPYDPADARTSLYVGVMMSVGANTSFNSGRAVPGIQVAMDVVNNSTDILPGYVLRYVLSNSLCKRTVALTAFFREVIQTKPVKLALLGGGCSVAAEATAEISYFQEIPQITCAASSPNLDNRELYQNHIQIVPNDLFLGDLIVTTMESFNWSEIVFIVRDDVEFFEQSFKSFDAKIRDRANLSSTKVQHVPSNANNLKNIFDRNNRIFFLAMYSCDAACLLCEAYNMGKRFPEYVFLTYGWYAPGWFLEGSCNCTNEEMLEMVNRSIAVRKHPVSTTPSQPSDAGGTSYVDYLTDYNERLKRSGMQFLTNGEMCFDGVWTLALALNKTINDLANNDTLRAHAANSNGFDDVTSCPSDDVPSCLGGMGVAENVDFGLENFTYGNEVVLDTVFKHLEETNFTGITGRVLFSENGVRKIHILRLQQYQGNSPESVVVKDVAYCFPNETTLCSSLNFTNMVTASSIWPNGIIPYDGVPMRAPITIHVALTVIMFFLATIGLVLTAFCVLFNIYFRDRKIIRLSSPKLNMMICVGAFLLYAAVYLNSYQPLEDEQAITILCNVRVWVWSIGYSLTFGPVLAKMWRVYYIFNNPTPKKRFAIQDWHLMIFVFLIMAFDLLVLLVSTAIPSSRLRAVKVPNVEMKEGKLEDMGRTITVEYDTYVCTSATMDSEGTLSETNNYLAWIAFLFAMKMFLHVTGILLAFATRKVKVKGLNDSKYIAVIIYITTVVLAVVIVSFITRKEYLNTLAGLYSMGFWLVATVILTLAFIPKMVNLYKDPKGELVFASTRAPTTSNGEEKVSSLKQKVRDLELRLARKESLLPDDERDPRNYRTSSVDMLSPPLISGQRRVSFELSAMNQVNKTDSTSDLLESVTEKTCERERDGESEEPYVVTSKTGLLNSSDGFDDPDDSGGGACAGFVEGVDSEASLGDVKIQMSGEVVVTADPTKKSSSNSYSPSTTHNSQQQQDNNNNDTPSSQPSPSSSSSLSSTPPVINVVEGGGGTTPDVVVVTVATTTTSLPRSSSNTSGGSAGFPRGSKV